MSIGELVARLGNDAIEVQNVTHNLVNARLVGKRGHQALHVTFATRPGLVDLGALALGGKSQYTGLILWVKTDAIEAARKQGEGQ